MNPPELRAVVAIAEVPEAGGREHRGIVLAGELERVGVRIAQSLENVLLATPSA